MIQPEQHLENLASKILIQLDEHHAPTDPSGIDSLAAGSARTACVAIIGYFLKYRYLDLTAVRMSADKPWRDWALPGRLDDSDSLRDESLQDKVADRITAIPWLGGLSRDSIQKSVNWLTRTGLLEFAVDPDVRAVGAPPAGIGVVRIRPNAEFEDRRVQEEFDRAMKNTRAAEISRRELLSDLGVGLTAIGGYETHQLFDNAGPNDTVKIATYHLRTVIAGKDLVDWLPRKPQIRVQILCLGPTSVASLSEGASPDSLALSVASGIQSFDELKQALPRKVWSRITIRIYGDVEGKAYFRGAILSTTSGDGEARPKRILATSWPFGESRANYGELLRLDGDSNLARLVLSYYDQAWRDAVPLSFAGGLEWTRWILRSVTVELVTTLAVGMAAGATLSINPSASNDAFYALLGTFPLLVITITRAIRQARRSISLSREIRNARSASPEK